MTPEEIEKAKSDFIEEPVIGSAKRCGVLWTPWMGDWFTSWSPRNSNSNAEGTWDHWVDLAIKILRDPMTLIVRPEAHAAGHLLPVFNFYDGSGRTLSDEELVERFTSPPPDPGGTPWAKNRRSATR